MPPLKPFKSCRRYYGHQELRRRVGTPSCAQRRDVLVVQLTAGNAVLVAITGRAAHSFPFGLFGGDGGPKLPPNTIRDPTLAYQFTYPGSTASGQPLPVTASRKPERYSSAAPLTADARQRIVCEYVSLANGVTVSVSVGPVPNTLLQVPVEQWKPTELALNVLTERSSARNTQGQRVPLATAEAAGAEERDGARYFVFDATQRGSPSLFDPSKETFRQSVNVTTTRPGLEPGSLYLYTFSLSGPNALWAELEGPFRESAASFRLLPPGRGYVPPDKDPWVFW